MKKLLLGMFFQGIILLPMFAAQTVNIYTPNGTIVEVDIISADEELSEYMINYRLNEIATSFPNATIISNPTMKYNCHGYAWHMSEGGDTCWIRMKTDYLNVEYNLSSYWTDGSYVETTSDKAQKIYYKGGDHSAIKGTNGKYISKWADGALVEHEPTYCPYNSSSLVYYARPGCNYGILSVSPMTDYIPLNTSRTFGNNTFTRTDFSYQWSIENAKGDNAITKGYATISKRTNNATISFSQEGIYTICLRVYDYSNYMVGYYSYEALVGEESDFLNQIDLNINQDSIINNTLFTNPINIQSYETE